MRKIPDDEKGVATCILCGKLLQGTEVVKYRDWHVHVECAQRALEKQVEGFNRLPFQLGSIGAVFGLILATPILLQNINAQNPAFYWIPFLGMAIALSFQAFGFYGFGSNYDENTGVISSIIAVAAAVSYLYTAILIIQFGYDPTYYDPTTNDFLLENIPNIGIGIFLSFTLLLLLMILTAIMILILGKSVTHGYDNRIVAIVFLGIAALMPVTPINFYVEMISVTILFLSARVPPEWRKIESG